MGVQNQRPSSPVTSLHLFDLDNEVPHLHRLPLHPRPRPGREMPEPEGAVSSYTPSDAQVLTHIAFVAEFSLTCSNGASNVALYADLNGALVPVVRSQDAGGRYQISWTTEVKHAKTGDHEVNLFDEEGYTAAKRAIESGEASAVKPLVTIVVNYPGAYKGPWINSELLAAALSILVFYLAYSSKSALLA